MTERTRRDLILFLHPFALRDVDGAVPAGRYLVETVEETIDTLSFVAYRRVSTTITLPALGDDPTQIPAFQQVITIDPMDLEAALAADEQREKLGWANKEVPRYHG